MPQELKNSCKEVIEANTKDNMTGAAYRLMSIELFLHVKKANVDPSILLLLETGVRLSELIYLSDEKQTPRRVLELYNITWLHHELCSKLFQSFHGDMSRSKFFGSYLHSLVVHAPLQLEIISLRSVNTEIRRDTLTKLTGQRLMLATVNLKMCYLPSYSDFKQKSNTETSLAQWNMGKAW